MRKRGRRNHQIAAVALTITVIGPALPGAASAAENAAPHLSFSPSKARFLAKPAAPKRWQLSLTPHLRISDVRAQPNNSGRWTGAGLRSAGAVTGWGALRRSGRNHAWSGRELWAEQDRRYSSLIATYLPAGLRMLPVFDALDDTSRQGVTDVTIGYTFAALRTQSRSFSDEATFRFQLLSGGRLSQRPQSFRSNDTPYRATGSKRWEAVVGGRFLVDLARKWTFDFRGDAGGFRGSAGSDMSWNVIGSVGRHVSDSVEFKVGYRVSRLDSGHSRSARGLDRLAQGPQIGFTVRF